MTLNFSSKLQKIKIKINKYIHYMKYLNFHKIKQVTKGLLSGNYSNIMNNKFLSSGFEIH